MVYIFLHYTKKSQKKATHYRLRRDGLLHRLLIQKRSYEES